MHSNGYSGAYCITNLVMRDGASERSENERECRLHTRGSLLDGEFGSTPFIDKRRSLLLFFIYAEKAKSYPFSWGLSTP
jgi:hypothetical protein